jgi:hypothetical protein
MVNLKVKKRIFLPNVMWKALDFLNSTFRWLNEMLGYRDRLQVQPLIGIELVDNKLDFHVWNR